MQSLMEDQEPEGYGAGDIWEAMKAMGSSALNQTGAGLASIPVALSGDIEGAADMIRLQENKAYKPAGRGGDLLQDVAESWPMQQLEKGTEFAGNRLGRMGDIISPEVGAAGYAIGKASPEILGAALGLPATLQGARRMSRTLDQIDTSKVNRGNFRQGGTLGFRGMTSPNKPDLAADASVTWATPDAEYANAYAFDGGMDGGNVTKLDYDVNKGLDFKLRDQGTEVTKENMLDRIHNQLMKDYAEGNIPKDKAMDIADNIQDAIEASDKAFKPAFNWYEDPDILKAAKDMGYDHYKGLEGVNNDVPTVGMFNPPGELTAPQGVSKKFPAYDMEGGMPGSRDGIGPNSPTEFEDAHSTAQANAALPVSQGGLGLPADNTAMQRADAMGFDTDTELFHGTTHDFDEFLGPDAPTANKEGHFGAGNYLTNSAYDASENYAGFGPDLTNRVEMRAEQLADLMRDDPKDFGLFDDADFERNAREMAVKELAGGSQGQIMPVMLRSENPMNLTDESPTQLGYDMPDPEDFMDEARDFVDRDDFDSPDDYEMELRDQAQEMAYENADPEGPLADMRESLDYSEYDTVDGGEAFDQAASNLDFEEGVDARDLIGELRDTNLAYAEDPYNGGVVGNEMIAKAVEDAGFSSIRMDANEAFPHMDMEGGTEHLIVRDPSRIRSRFAAFDPFKKNSSNILAGTAAGGMTTAEILDLLDEKTGNEAL